MAHAAPSASEKEKTARLIASLSCKEQAELLAQALLREFMHRRGLHETLKAFDTENPRDARTISSRAMMRQLLNIPVADRPSRLQPTVSAATGKPQPPTFMEELCSYRLTKRGYTHPVIKLGDEKSDSEEDPSDVEVRALQEAVEVHRTAKATCEQKQRRYEELLAEEESYQRRKEAHKHKKQKKKKKRTHGKNEGSAERRGSGNVVSDDDDDDEANDATDEEDLVGGGLLVQALGRRLSSSLSRRGSADTSFTGGTGTGWQPPGLAPATSGDDKGGSSAHPHASSQPSTTALAPEGSDVNTAHEEAPGEEAVDPFGSTASSQQALMARVRAESRHWANQHSQSGLGGSGELSNLTTPKKGIDAGAAPAQPSPLAALSGVPRGLALGGDGSSLRLGIGGSGLSRGNARLSATPAGYNPHAVRFGAVGSPGLDGNDAAAAVAAGAANAGDGVPVTPYSNGFPPPPTSALAPSIMVKHHSDGQRRAGGAASGLESSGRGVGRASSPTTGILAAAAGGAGSLYDRSAVPRSSALASGATKRSPAEGEGRSPSPIVAGMSDEASSFHTPSRSANNAGLSGSGSGSGLRHGIGFRTSVSADGAAPSSNAAAGGGGAHAGGANGEGGARHNRKERRVKLLID